MKLAPTMVPPSAGHTHCPAIIVAKEKTQTSGVRRTPTKCFQCLECRHDPRRNYISAGNNQAIRTGPICDTSFSPKDTVYLQSRFLVSKETHPDLVPKGEGLSWVSPDHAAFVESRCRMPRSKLHPRKYFRSTIPVEAVQRIEESAGGYLPQPGLVAADSIRGGLRDGDSRYPDGPSRWQPSIAKPRSQRQQLPNVTATAEPSALTP